MPIILFQILDVPVAGSKSRNVSGGKSFGVLKPKVIAGMSINEDSCSLRYFCTSRLLLFARKKHSNTDIPKLGGRKKKK
jgi:hypothetical protein